MNLFAVASYLLRVSGIPLDNKGEVRYNSRLSVNRPQSYSHLNAKSFPDYATGNKSV